MHNLKGNSLIKRYWTRRKKKKGEQELEREGNLGFGDKWMAVMVRAKFGEVASPLPILINDTKALNAHINI